MSTFIDTHAHLDFPDFDTDREAVIARAAAAGITRIITIGTTAEGSRAAIALAEAHANVFAAAGWHPSHASEAPEEIGPAFAALLRSAKVAAIGECGLDYSRLPGKSGGGVEEDQRCIARQRSLFEQQLALAAEHRLNVIVHQRDSFADTLELLRPWASKVRAVFHCFVGSPAEMRQVLDLNSIVSFTGIATFKNASLVRETLATAPLGQFMLETDCPFLAPVPHRGKRCEPAYVTELARFAADLKGCSLEELAEGTNRAAEGFFRFAAAAPTTD